MTLKDTETTFSTSNAAGLLLSSALWLAAVSLYLIYEVKTELFSFREEDSLKTLFNLLTEPMGLLFLAALLMGLARLTYALKALRAKARLLGRDLSFIDIETLVKLKGHLPKDSVYLGEGFTWDPEKSRIAYALTKEQPEDFAPSRFLSSLLLLRQPKDPAAIGSGWLHGISAREVPITVSEKALEGGTLIVGTTQSGKGVLLTLLITQAILKGDAVIVIDPKNSPRTLAAIERATAFSNRPPPLVFNPASAGSIHINPLANFTRPSEIASRLVACLRETGPFAAFAWRAVFVAVTLILALKKEPTVALVEGIIATDAETTVMKLAERVFTREAIEKGKTIATGRTSKEKLAYSLENLLATAPPTDEVLRTGLKEGITLLRGNTEHEAKLRASLLPLLASLTAGNLKRTLTEDEANPFIPSVTLKGVVENTDVLYIATDALADSYTASSLATLFLADLASLAAYRYNNRLPAKRVSVFVDEASNAMSDALIELLNKGAEAGIRTTCAMQTVSDLEARLASDAAARMALGNFNNLIALRTKDLETARFAVETFGKTAIPETQSSLTSASASDAPGRFAANFTRRTTATREELVAPDWLGRLPNTEFFASLAGGRILKGRIPILVQDRHNPSK